MIIVIVGDLVRAVEGLHSLVITAGRSRNWRPTKRDVDGVGGASSYMLSQIVGMGQTFASSGSISALTLYSLFIPNAAIASAIN